LRPVSRCDDAGELRTAWALESFTVTRARHYDPADVRRLFSELGIPEADLDLGVGSGSHGRQTARMLEGLEQAMEVRRPDLVLTYGDTNSTLAATLAAAKLHVPVAHVEAGLRSFNRRMPEEANRLVADHLSDLLFAPTPEAMRNLEREGLADRARQVGDVMLDALRAFAPVARERSRVLERLGISRGGYLVATLHRAENTDASRLAALLSTLAKTGTPAGRWSSRCIRARPRDAGRRNRAATWRGPADRRTARLLDMIALVADARMVLTDSGGLQKEAFFLGRPCVTLREETEWVETVTGGGNVVAGPTTERSAPRSPPGTLRSRAVRRTSQRASETPSAMVRLPAGSSRRYSNSCRPNTSLSAASMPAPECATGHV
jgi:UDP-N-acetylglucosamine 2-epimerase